MRTILITSQPDIAHDAVAAGVTRIMVDLESHGKKERQASRSTFISAHVPEDIAVIRQAIPNNELIVRINPWGAHSTAEIDHAMRHGANVIMLPMITDLRQIDAALGAINGRAQLLPLLENAYCLAHIQTIAKHPDLPEIYIGFNDLHLSLGLDFLFEPLALGLIDPMAAAIHAAKKTFGMGGIARMGSGELPAEMILAEHVRLGSHAVILSSQFLRDVEIDIQENRVERISKALELMNNNHALLKKRSAEEAVKDHALFGQRVAMISTQLAHKRRPVI